MTQPVPPADAPSGPERRRAERVRPGPLRVRLHRLSAGTLIDVSDLGALVLLPSAPAPDKPITLQLEWKDKTVLLRGRVVRSTPHRLQSRNAVLTRTEHQVAMEFRDLSPEALAAVKQIMEEHRGRDG